MTLLDDLFEQWLSLYDTADQFGLAGLFSAYAHPSYRRHKNRVLYVGKATAKNFDREAFIQTRLRSTLEQQQHVQSTAGRIFKRSAGQGGANFWGLANDLSKLLDDGVTDISNVIWSNVAKIGTVTSNPDGPLLEMQLDLAQQTLRAEIRAFQPSIVVFVTNKFAESAVRAVVDGNSDDAWKRSDKQDEQGHAEDIWLMEAIADRPAVLWMRHPERSPLLLRQHAREHVRELLWL